VVFELKYSESCLAERDDHSSGWDCFGVGIRFNGVDYNFEKEGFCTGDGFNHQGTGCTYREFNYHLRHIWYRGPHAPDLDFACTHRPHRTGPNDFELPDDELFLI